MYTTIGTFYFFRRLSVFLVGSNSSSDPIRTTDSHLKITKEYQLLYT